MTNEEKQIEEMAVKLGILACEKSPCRNCGVTDNCDWRKTAIVLYNAGYRKTSDVARKIFAEIEEMLKNHYHSNKILSEDNGIMITVKHSARTSFATVLRDVAELKKKYESEDTE